MRWLVCPDSFEDCLPAERVAQAIEAGLRAADPAAVVRCLPLADGGEGTVAALLAATGGKWHRSTVDDPLGRPVEARWGLLPDGTAVLEMAAASGLPLLAPPERDPRCTSTSGTGQLLSAALDVGARRIVLGIGGSATNDGGAGLAQALGVKLRDADGQDLPAGGAALAGLAGIDASGLDSRLRETELLVACDVDNPLCGPRGASAVYGPQKGAKPEVVAELDAALAVWARRLQLDLGTDVADRPGAGAAGGLGAGLLALCGAKLVAGIDLVMQAAGFDRALAEADVVITAEGRLDASTLEGKVIAGVCRRAKVAGLPVIALGGEVLLSPEQCQQLGLLAALSLSPGPQSLDEALAGAEHRLADVAWAVGRLYGTSS